MSREHLARHLASWGLRSFTSDAPYFAWQRATLSPAQLARLQELSEAREGGKAVAEDQAFYDYSADPAILPVLYSQRYGYYLAVGPAVADRIGEARTILDVGCGPGILTTFYAATFPDRAILGLDRSAACVASATARASALGLSNLRFVAADLATWDPDHPYDLVLATQSLFQAEGDPGLPSRAWDSFERPADAAQQPAFETRTGLGLRLDRLRGALAPAGRALLFEKTGHLARRVPFQRALAARDFWLIEVPVALPYRLVEEPVGDELLYHLGAGAGGGPARRGLAWPEAPTIEPRDELFVCHGEAARQTWTALPDRQPLSGETAAEPPGRTALELGRAGVALRYLFARGPDGRTLLAVGSAQAETHLRASRAEALAAHGDTLDWLLERMAPRRDARLDDTPLDQVPLYENHHPAAQAVWASLPDRRVVQEATAAEPDGRQLHLELGTSGTLAYVYCANTFDQRQLVIMDPARRPQLDAYYGELYEANRRLFERA